jgi:subtilisin family serine protease
MISPARPPALLPALMHYSFIYSALHLHLTLAAAGVSVNSACPVTSLSPAGYCLESGTSQATPHVAGIFARCYASGACRESLGSHNVQQALQEFALYSSENPGYGFQQDPAHGAAGSVNHYGWLSWADAY